MRVVKKISVNTYDCSVIYIISDSLKNTEKYLLKKYGGENTITFDANEAEGITVTLSGNLYVVMIDHKYISHNTIAHELYHATRRITEDRDIDDEESIAWVAGYLSEEFYKFLSSPKVKKEFDKLIDKSKDGTGSAESK